MPNQLQQPSSTGLVIVGEQPGIAFVPGQPAPLTRLNYFDGKFLRADDMAREQAYLRRLVQFSNQAGGAGVVYGFDATLSGERLSIGRGLAIDGEGRLLYLSDPAVMDVGDLIKASTSAPGETRSPLVGRGILSESPGIASASFVDCEMEASNPPGDVLQPADYWVITICAAEALCGEEDVYGRLCEDACATDSDRPYRVEGVLVRATPLRLTVPLPSCGLSLLSRAHLRSRLASAYFEQERRGHRSLISGAGLRSEAWCTGGELDGGACVALGVVARSGGATSFLDAWTVRRERIESPARRYWASTMAMRPLDVYLAQILQFQCQLIDALLCQTATGPDDDPCIPDREAIDEAATLLEEIRGSYSTFLTERSEAISGLIDRPVLSAGTFGRIADLQSRLAEALRGVTIAPRDRVLIRCGVVELPSAGYLPVDPGSTASVNDQVIALLGDGVDLRFCIVRPDYVAHALEEAQHMERISLLCGIDDPAQRPRVDILVPNGERAQRVAPPGLGFDGQVTFLPTHDPGTVEEGSASALLVRGAGRAEVTNAGGMAFRFAGLAAVPSELRVRDVAAAMARSIFGTTRRRWPGTLPIEKVPRASEADHVSALEDLEFRANARVLAADATRFLRAMRPTGPMAEMPERFMPTEAADGTVAALWLDARIDDDPFMMGQNDSTSIMIRGAGTAPGQHVDHADGVVFGDVRFDQISSVGADERVVNAHFTGTFSFTAVSGGGPPQSGGASLNFDLQIRLTRPGGVPTVEILFPTPSDRTIGVRATWGGSPFSFSVDLFSSSRSLSRSLGAASSRRAVIEPEFQRIATSTFTRDDDVLTISDSRHQSALNGVTIVGTALSDPGFVGEASQALFAPAGLPTEELAVRATMDWVLFCRRREEDCGEAVAPPVALRRFAVFERKAADEERLQGIVDTVREGDDERIARLRFRTVGTVEFTGVATTPSTPATALRADWEAVAPGSLVGYGAVALHGTQEGEAVAKGRVAAYEQTLAPVSTVVPGGAIDVLSTFPSSLDVPGADGAMVFVTMDAEAETVCHRVFAVRGQRPIWSDELEPNLGTGILSEDVLKRLLKEGAFVDLGVIEYAAGSLNELNQALVMLGDADPSLVNAAVVLARVLFADPMLESQATMVEQSNDIQTRVGAFNENSAQAIRVPAEPPGGCPLVTLIILETD